MRADAVSAILLAVLGVYAALTARGFGLGKLSEPGAGFFPFWASVLMVACAAIIVFRSVLRMREGRPGPLEAPPPVANWNKVALCVVALLAYAVLLPLVGVLATTFVFIFALTRFYPETSWRGSLAIAAIGAFGFWLVFARLMAVRFPPSLIGL